MEENSPLDDAGPEEEITTAQKVHQVAGGAITKTLIRVSEKLAEKKADNTISDREYYLISRLINGEEVYSEPCPIGVGIQVIFRNLKDPHFRMSKILAVKNPEGRAKGEELEFDIGTEGLMQIVMALIQINDEELEPIDPPSRDDYVDQESFGKAMNKFMEVVNERINAYKDWPGPMLRNTFLGLSKFFSEMDALFENKVLENFLRPPTDTSLENDSVGGSEDTK